MERIPKGTIEHLLVDCSDRLGNITTLDGLNGRFDVERDTDDVEVVSNGSIINVGMTAYCLVDTSQVAFTKGRYRLYVQFDSPPESPRLGPHEFEVI